MKTMMLLLILTLTACSCSDKKSDAVTPVRPAPGVQGDCTLLESGFGPIGRASVALETVAENLEVPWAIAFLPSGDWLVTERPGRVRLIHQGVLQTKPVVTISVGESGEGGLLGIATHPEFATNRLFYVYYTGKKNSETVNRIESYRLSSDGTEARVDRTILDNIPAGTFHDGGRIRFGADGYLYIGTGDGRNPDLAQSDSSLSGKILRIRDDGTVPPSNPIPGSMIFVKGVRNPEAFDWYNASTLVIADHGPSGELGRTGHDEISFANSGDNLGWPTIYGCQKKSGMASPFLSWVNAVPPGGAAIYKGSRIPEWQGNLLVGTLGSKHLHRIVFDSTNAFKHEVYFQGDPPAGFGRLREVIMSPDGELYITTSNCDGRGTCPPSKDKILRLVNGLQ